MRHFRNAKSSYHYYIEGFQWAIRFDGVFSIYKNGYVHGSKYRHLSTKFNFFKL